MNRLLVFLMTVSMSLPCFAEKLHNQPVVRQDALEYDDSRVVFLGGRVDAALALDVTTNLRLLDQSSGPITLVIDSGGGSIDAGLLIVESMAALKNPLQCIINKNAYSMAAVISSFCPKLYVQRFAMIMFHEAAYSVRGKQSEIKNTISIMEKFIANVNNAVAAVLGLPVEVLVERQHDEWWINAEEAVGLGFASAVLNTAPVVPLPPEDDEDLI